MWNCAVLQFQLQPIKYQVMLVVCCASLVVCADLTLSYDLASILICTCDNTELTLESVLVDL